MFCGVPATEVTASVIRVPVAEPAGGQPALFVNVPDPVNSGIDALVNVSVVGEPLVTLTPKPPLYSQSTPPPSGSSRSTPLMRPLWTPPAPDWFWAMGKSHVPAANVGAWSQSENVCDVILAFNVPWMVLLRTCPPMKPSHRFVMLVSGPVGMVSASFESVGLRSWKFDPNFPCWSGLPAPSLSTYVAAAATAVDAPRATVVTTASNPSLRVKAQPSSLCGYDRCRRPRRATNAPSAAVTAGRLSHQRSREVKPHRCAIPR